MDNTHLKTGRRWRPVDYQNALIELRGAYGQNGTRTHKIFKGLTKQNGFDVNRPEKITRAKRKTIKKLIHDLQVIRSRKVIFMAPRKKSRIYQAKKSSGFRSPYMAAFPMPVVPNLRASIRWVKDRPVVEYPDIGVRSYTAGIQKAPIYRALKEAMDDDESTDVIIPETLKQIADGHKIIKQIAGANDLVRYRLRTVYGDLEAGNVYGITDSVEILAENLGAFLERYEVTDKQGNFFVGYTIWSVNTEKAIPESYKPTYEKEVKKGAKRGQKKQTKRQRIRRK